MKTGKLWFGAAILVLLLAASAVGSAIWNSLSAGWGAQATAAQYALDHTALSQISSHTTYSGPGGVEDVFWGLDAFRRPVVAFVRLQPASAICVSSHTLLPKAQTLALSRRYAPTSEAPIFATVGYLDAATKQELRTEASFVWEVTYSHQGQYDYRYLNGETGALLQWK